MDNQQTFPEPAQSPLEELQFDRAIPERGEAADAKAEPAACARCREGISGAYYVGSGVPFCRACTDEIRVGDETRPSVSELFGGLAWGLGGAALGCVIYFMVLWLSGYEIGFIAVIVGWLVGKAVHRGSNGRGGWKLQTLAVALTYFAIVTSYVPLIVKGMMKPEAQKAAGQDTVPPAGTANGAEPAVVVEAAPEPISIWMIPVALALAFAGLLALPFLAGFDNIFGLVVIAIGLFEAWKINRRERIDFNGPVGGESA